MYSMTVAMMVTVAGAPQRSTMAIVCSANFPSAPAAGGGGDKQPIAKDTPTSIHSLIDSDANHNTKREVGVIDGKAVPMER